LAQPELKRTNRVQAKFINSLSTSQYRLGKRKPKLEAGIIPKFTASACGACVLFVVVTVVGCYGSAFCAFGQQKGLTISSYGVPDAEAERQVFNSADLEASEG
jgi:hypothetical protein